MGQRQQFKYRILWTYLLFFLLLVQAVAAGTGVAKEKSEKGPGSNTTELLKAIKNAVLVETTSLEELKNRLGRLDILQKAVFIEINAYNIQNSAHSNFLLQPETPVTDLEKALAESRLALNTINDKIKDFTKRRGAVNELSQQTQDEINLSAKQGTEIKSSDWPKSEKASLLAALGQLDRKLSEKHIALQNLHERLDPVIKQLETLRGSTSQLTGKLEQQIKSRKSQELFSRKFMLRKVFQKDAVAKEFDLLVTNLVKAFQKDLLQG